MRRVRSTLSSPGYPILITAGVNLFLLLCFCVWLQMHRLPRFGVNVYPEASHFAMDAYNRDNLHIITITAGNTPRVYAEGELIEGGMDGLPARLDAWAAGMTTRRNNMTIILQCDPAASAGVLQKAIDMVLQRKFTCSVAGRPAIK
jgi:hypothetical protein